MDPKKLVILYTPYLLLRGPKPPQLENTSWDKEYWPTNGVFDSTVQRKVTFFSFLFVDLLLPFWIEIPTKKVEKSQSPEHELLTFGFSFQQI